MKAVLPALPKPDANGRFPAIEYTRVSLARNLIRDRKSVGLSQERLAAMRHSTIDLTMNVYTDPKLLDVCGALDSLPLLNLNASPSTENNWMQATGIDCRKSSPSTNSPNNAPATGFRGPLGSFAGIASGNADRRTTRGHGVRKAASW